LGQHPGVPLIVLAVALSFDALAYRRRIGAERFAVEIARRAQGRGWSRSRAQAERLAAMQVAADGPTPAVYRDRARRLARFDAEAGRQIDAAASGRYRPDWLNRRWLNTSFAARDPDRRELLRRVFADQFEADAEVPTDIRPAAMTLYTARKGAIERANVVWLKGVLARIGWFDISRYGEEASQAAWLIVQHADFDPAWQKQVAAELEPRVRRGDMQGKWYAYLVDRIAVNGQALQSYGTQGRCAGPADWQPLPVDDPQRLDERRAAVGLEPIAAYRARFTCR
jgi:hypothetical protein